MHVNVMYQAQKDLTLADHVCRRVALVASMRFWGAPVPASRRPCGGRRVIGAAFVYDVCGETNYRQ